MSLPNSVLPFSEYVGNRHEYYQVKYIYKKSIRKIGNILKKSLQRFFDLQKGLIFTL